MSDDDNEPNRTAVRTYIPEHQKEVWKEDADSMDMSLSEFVRSMAQAGRRGFDLSDGQGTDNVESTGGGNVSVEIDVVESLRAEPYLTFEQLVAKAEDDFESAVADRLETLRDEGTIRRRIREGGYFVVDDG